MAVAFTQSTERSAPSLPLVPARMRAIIQRGYGKPNVFSFAEIEPPAIAANEVLVQVGAAGVDRGTWHVMTGRPYPARLFLGLRTPRQRVPGLDLAGVVVATGADVTRFRPGDEVFGIGQGSFAEFSSALEAKLVHKPATITFEHAAALSISGLTALQGLTDVGKLKSGQRVLILGASGGVGTFAVQIALALGAEVTGVCSTVKLDLIRSIGAHHVIDYTREDPVSGTTRYDLILDIGGSRSLRQLRKALTPTGTLVIVGGEGGDRLTGGLGRNLRAALLTPFIGQRLTAFISREDLSSMQRLAEFVERGEVTPVVDRTYPLDDVAGALRHLEGGHARGKLVIVP